MYACMNGGRFKIPTHIIISKRSVLGCSSPLIDLTSSNGPQVSGISRLASVSQVYPNGSWILLLRRSPLVILLFRACLPIQPSDTDSSQSDQCL
ncbi:uncharacterized protein LOC110227434 [Arabidopsis lyrata subsp. lyrata]|uniref:uncharacterized protein LOC110227434 n=1 Tax=Arabidopsis lyrata subsp. lyrata TaxID=81972 RepID=UPI000A29A89D|nr:uncharacterized protein LOC110227434 [Arabidopsis lyrata subsp. lyrata]|eukprot:XP_020877188.1 uncharacterized protein LOC110227434 [Arabidopsis lyrata subsp. lyrata]